MDEQGRPLYGDVFGLQQPDANILDDEQVDSTLWGELESESEESEESEVNCRKKHITIVLTLIIGPLKK